MLGRLCDVNLRMLGGNQAFLADHECYLSFSIQRNYGMIFTHAFPVLLTVGYIAIERLVTFPFWMPKTHYEVCAYICVGNTWLHVILALLFTSLEVASVPPILSIVARVQCPLGPHMLYVQVRLHVCITSVSMQLGIWVLSCRLKISWSSCDSIFDARPHTLCVG